MSILSKAQVFVKQLLTEKLPSSHLYHNYEQTERIVQAAEEIAKTFDLNHADHEVLMLAAWFQSTGYISNYDEHEEESQKIAKDFLKMEKVEEQKIEETLAAINSTKRSLEPVGTIQEILHDASLYHISQGDYLKVSQNLRKEWEHVYQKSFSSMDWFQSSIKFIIESKFYTPYGIEVLDPKKDKVLKDLKKKMKKHQAALDISMEKELGVSPAELKDLKKKLMKVEGRPERGIETMFRLTSKNHLTLSGMADTKANIMISVNSIILSILIGSLMQKLDNNPQLIVPTYIMLVVNLGSIIFSILSTRPNITSGKFTRADIENNKTNLLFFGNFHKMQRPDYQWGMHRLMEDGKFLYSSLIDDIFFLGVVLGRKYRFLRISYNIFMYGMVLAVLSFMITNIFLQN